MTAPQNRIGTNLFAPVGPVSPLVTPILRIALADEVGLAMYAECLGTLPTTANTFAHGCLMVQKDSGTGVNALYQNTGSSAVPAFTLIDTALAGGTAQSLVDTNGNPAMTVGTTASAVNHLNTINAAASGAPVLSAVGTDTNISIGIKPKGTGTLTLGVSTGTLTGYHAANYIGTESGANNAIAGALVDAAGSNIALAAGLKVIVKLAHTLQAGANTFVLNGTSKSIKSHFNVSNNIGTAYAATGIIELIYDGAEWLDCSQ